MDKLHVIASCKIFGAVAPARQSELAKVGRIVRFGRGQSIFRQDDPVPGMYIVITGLARVFKIAMSGKEHTLHLAGPGQTFAEVAAIAAFPCPACAEAVDETEALLLPTDAFRRMLELDHSLCLELLTGMGVWVRHLTSLLEDIVLRDAASRVARQLLAAPRSADRIALFPGLRKHLANQLNLTPETLSRTFHRFAEAGLITVLDDQRIRLDDLDGLTAASSGG